MLCLLPRPALTVLLPVVRADCGIGLAAFRGEIALTPQHELAYSRSLLAPKSRARSLEIHDFAYLGYALAAAATASVVMLKCL